MFNLEFKWISFSKALEELKTNFKVVDKIISDKNGKSFVKNENKPQRHQSQITNTIVHDIETLNTDRAVPYSIFI